MVGGRVGVGAGAQRQETGMICVWVDGGWKGRNEHRCSEAGDRNDKCGWMMGGRVGVSAGTQRQETAVLQK